MEVIIGGGEWLDLKVFEEGRIVVYDVIILLQINIGVNKINKLIR